MIEKVLQYEYLVSLKATRMIAALKLNEDC